jgi:PPOX class probable F420-dependent enzyme
VSAPPSAGVRAFLAEQPVGVLATQRANGSIRQSVVYHVLDGDRLLISTLSKRAKARDVRRTGRASYCVVAHAKPFAMVTVEGSARILTTGIAETTGRIFARITGQPAAPFTDEVLAGMDRVILEIAIERVSAVAYVPSGDGG